jgi:hypothetical protein
MNIYDPSDHICYVHLSGPADARSAGADDTTACASLPSGYANQSPKTRLQRRPAQPPWTPGGGVVLTAPARPGRG